MLSVTPCVSYSFVWQGDSEYTYQPWDASVTFDASLFAVDCVRLHFASHTIKPADCASTAAFMCKAPARHVTCAPNPTSDGSTATTRPYPTFHEFAVTFPHREPQAAAVTVSVEVTGTATAVPDDAGLVIDGVTLYALTPSPMSPWTRAPLSGSSMQLVTTGTSLQAGGLDALQTYCAVVGARTTAGVGPWSTTVELSTTSPSRPSSPRSLDVEADTTTGGVITLAWQPPSDLGGVPLNDKSWKYTLSYLVPAASGTIIQALVPAANLLVETSDGALVSGAEDGTLPIDAVRVFVGGLTAETS